MDVEEEKEVKNGGSLLGGDFPCSKVRLLVGAELSRGANGCADVTGRQL
jgi:hypothetical protein